MKKLVFDSNRHKAEWTRGTEKSVFVSNIRLGVSISHYSIIDDEDNYLYDTIGIEEKPGACIVVMINQEKKLGLINQYRPVPEQYLLSCIRGFNEREIPGNDIVRQEILEESGITEIRSIKKLGITYPNSTFFVNPVSVFLAEVDANDIYPLTNPDHKYEGVESILFFGIEDVQELIASNKIQCQMTLSALSLYLSKMYFEKR